MNRTMQLVTINSLVEHSSLRRHVRAFELPGRAPPLLAEKSLREGRDEADLDDESQHCLYASQYRDRVVQVRERLETPTVEATHAEDERLVPGEWLDLAWRQTKRNHPVGCPHVEVSEPDDDGEVK